MYLTNKTFHPVNFSFADRRRSRGVAIDKRAFDLEAVGTAEDVYRVRLTSRSLWPRDWSRAGLTPLAGASAACRGSGSRLTVGNDMSISLSDPRGRVVLRSTPGRSFGVCGSAWLFQFRQSPAMRFYGMGEKSTPFEKSGRVHRFWNTDAWADFSYRQVEQEHYDPDYLSVPYVIVKQGNTYCGLLIDSPCAPSIGIEQASGKQGDIYLGAEDGPASLYIIYGPSLPELTRKLQNLTGRAPLPPLWALGYQQCRWGYAGTADLGNLADHFERHRFPADGLWLDIDYMDGYRVFTFSRTNVPDPAKDFAALRSRGFRVVPIIDPGVKQEKGYAVYDSGAKAGIFCRNSQGREFIGLVWPGYTAFPDYSLPEARRWWAAEVKRFAESGVAGAWLDMNDPSTGRIDCTGMLFERGRAPHAAYHNQYALLMAEASREGFLAARPNARPFLLCRSGFTGSQKYTAHWLGDNFSNYHHLHACIGKTLNLALSGVVHNGPDIGGFGGNTTAELMVDWMKACFLFPVCRNHTCAGTRQQEPWAFGRRTLELLRHYTRLRYKLLPYLYNLFVQHEETGEAILRPLFYDFADNPTLNLAGVDDQFMVGPSLMQAPFVREGERTRKVVLPPGRWYQSDTGRWVSGGRNLTARKAKDTTPLFVRDGALLPMQRGIPIDNRKDLTSIELWAFLTARTRGKSVLRYAFDDGETFDYRKGRRSDYELTARVSGRDLYISVDARQEGFGALDFTPFTVERFRSVVVTRGGERVVLKPTAVASDLFGAKAHFFRYG